MAIPSAYGVALAAVLTVACGGNTPAAPTPQCGRGGDLIGTGFGGPTVLSGFDVDRNTLPNDGLGLTIRVGERSRVRFKVGRPLVTGGCGADAATFTYVMWSWNWITPTGRNPIDMPLTPRSDPVEVTVASCRRDLFGEPFWTAVSLPLNGTPHWEQRAWLHGDQSFELEVRGIASGSTSFLVSAFVGQPYSRTNPVQDNTTSQLHVLRASVIP